MSNAKTNDNAQVQTPESVASGKLIKFLANTAKIEESEVVLLGLWIMQNKDSLIAKLAELSAKNLSTDKEIEYL